MERASSQIGNDINRAPYLGHPFILIEALAL
jgi:hypothetical protein